MSKKENLPKKATKKKNAVSKKTEEIDLLSISKLILQGDLSGLSEKEKLQYYGALCKSLHLNPYTKPFDYIVFERNGRRFETLYATKNCAEQLRKNLGISVVEENRTITDEYVIYDVKVQDATGRTDTGTGVVSFVTRGRDGKMYKLSGTAYADAIMKAQSKAKRRATLSIAGVGFLDETELDFVYNGKEVETEVSGQIESSPDNEELMKRQELINRYARLSGELRRKISNAGFSIDEALKLCEKYDFDEATIKVELEVGDASETDDFF